MIRTKLQKEFPVLATIPTDKFPQHIFIIPDGNGRWAKERGKFVTAGHKKGFEAAYTILKMLHDIEEISVVTIWGFSADNWRRSEKEVAGLMLLFERVIRKTLKDLLRNNGRFIHLGRKDRIPKRLLSVIDDAEVQTKGNTGQIVCLAIDFGGEDQEVRLMEKVHELDKKFVINQDTLWQLRDSAGSVRSADLLIRTSGEKRLSDVGWINGPQTELYFLEKYFPDVTPSDIVEAIVDFSQRERRLGGRKNEDEHIVLVDEKNNPLGTAPKLATHNNNTPLHRGFSVFLFRKDGKLLLQQRSHAKKTWPLVWSNSCCGHPMLNESPIDAAKRRLAYELGMHAPKIHMVLPKYRYRVEREDIVENEICPVMVGFSDEKPKKNSEEVEAVRWISWEDWLQEVKTHPREYSQWCVEETMLLTKDPQFRKLLHDNLR